ncbi:MAG: tetratricopeptide repeat protein [Proteobacteria bacterium]|nr:tetratricopeptide repeat protein [Pseudomonadota bacterium]MBS0330840.1 tetratricopeptide repeat protein [Pseudomonadota bacterium]
MAKKNILTQSKKAKADSLALANRLEEALMLYASACKTDPTDVEAWVKLGATQRRLGRYAEAEASGRRAVLLAPNQTFAHHTLGVALQCQGKLEDAMSCYRQAIQLKPDYPDPHYLLGNALLQSGQLHDAESSLRQALALRPTQFEALSDLGALLLTLNRIDEAAHFLQLALGQRPDSIEVLANLGSLKEKTGDMDGALECYRQALSRRPDSPDVLAKQGELLERLGNLDEAEAAVTHGLASAPNHPLLNLVAARLDRRNDRLAEGVARLERILDHPMPLETRCEVHLLLGQLHDRMGNTEQVMPHLSAGKRGVDQATDPDGSSRARFLARIDQARTWLGSEASGLDQREPPPSEDTPIFLIGFPRSGTTLLEQVLDSHPALQALEEKPMVAVMEQAFLALTGGGSGALQALSEAHILELRRLYFQEAERHLVRWSGSRLVDKLPLNIVSVPLIWRVFPEARFILALRHPCDVALSCMMQSFAHNDAMAGFVSLENIAEIYARVMEAWHETTERIPLQWQRIRYEDLITNFEPEAKKLLEFIGVGWSDAVLEHTRHAQQRLAIQTPSYHQVTQPIYQHARYRWKRYEDGFQPVMATLQPFIERFGYQE